MNNKRRKKLEILSAEIEQLNSRIQDVYDEEQECLDNIYFAISNPFNFLSIEISLINVSKLSTTSIFSKNLSFVTTEFQSGEAVSM